MNKIPVIFLLITLALTCFAQQTETVDASNQSTDDALIERLQNGGLVLLFRHGETGPDSDNADAVSGRSPAEGNSRQQYAAYFDCARQRNLSDAGRRDLTRIATAMQRIGMLVGEVLASPMCRTRETAWILVGEVMSSDALIGPENPQRTNLASEKPAAGHNRVLVSHGYVVKNIVDNPRQPDERGQLPRGHVHVLEPLGNGVFTLLAQLGPDDWLRLAELATQSVPSDELH